MQLSVTKRPSVVVRPFVHPITHASSAVTNFKKLNSRIFTTSPLKRSRVTSNRRTDERTDERSVTDRGMDEQANNTQTNRWTDGQQRPTRGRTDRRTD